MKVQDIVSDEELKKACEGLHFVSTERIALMMAVSRKACGVRIYNGSKTLLIRLGMIRNGKMLTKRGKDYLADILKIEK